MASSISTMCNSIVDSCQEAEEAMRELSNAEDRYGYGQGTTHARPDFTGLRRATGRKLLSGTAARRFWQSVKPTTPSPGARRF